jgi:RNA polymerase sigma factor for flagellar operon FliA
LKKHEITGFANSTPQKAGLGTVIAVSTRLSASQEALFIQNIPLVKAIVVRIWGNLPSQADFDDLLQAGSLGLLDAVRKFDPEKKVPFECYAKFRIRGSVLDSLRDLDELSRADRKKVKLQQQSEQLNTERLNECSPSRPRQGDIHLCFMRSTIRIAATSTCDASENEDRVLDPAAAADSPEQLYRNAVTRKLLTETVSGLPPRYQQIISLYYDGEMTMKEIANALGVNESRISQMHKLALSKMASSFTKRGYQSSDMLSA